MEPEFAYQLSIFPVKRIYRMARQLNASVVTSGPRRGTPTPRTYPPYRSPPIAPQQRPARRAPRRRAPDRNHTRRAARPARRRPEGKARQGDHRHNNHDTTRRDTGLYQQIVEEKRVADYSASASTTPVFIRVASRCHYRERGDRRDAKQKHGHID